LTFVDLDWAARKLSHDDRIELAYPLLQSVDDQEDPEYERLWMEEIERRYREIEEGSVKSIPGKQVLAKIQAELASLKSKPQIREDAKIVRSFADIERDALQLPVDEQMDLAYAILRSLESEGFQIDWEQPEVVGRSREAVTAK
jgi:putative addiction module component (TIGR02574 family)